MPDSTRVALVTGVTGQDGFYLAEHLMESGYDVHGLVHWADTLAPVDGVIVHAGDITDYPSLGQLVRAVEPDLVFNLAGVSSVAASWEDPVFTAEATGLGAVALMDATWQEQERSGREIRFLQASSAEIFGETSRVLQDETTPVQPVNPYGAAKAFAHHSVHVYRQRGMHASSLILFNHESPRRPPTFVTRKITSGVAGILRGELDVLRLGNMDSRRDWGWAPDYVDAMVRAVQHPEPSDYVVATGVAHSVREFVDAAFRHVGIDDWGDVVAPDERFKRPAEARILCGDASRAQRVLGWRPTVPFEEIVGRMVDADVSGD